jgi:hypothetical protein
MKINENMKASDSCKIHLLPAASFSISLMVMATSGHIVQHNAQKMQSSGRA